MNAYIALASHGVRHIDPDLFDNLDDDEAETPHPDSDSDSGSDSHPQLGPLCGAPEDQFIPFPSNLDTCNNTLRKKELEARIHQATRNLIAIRELIAEKSFQYTHVMRNALQKSVHKNQSAHVREASFKN